MQAQAEQEIAQRQQQADALYAEAVELLQEEQWQAALDKLAKTREIVPNHLDTQGIEKIATARLRMAIQVERESTGQASQEQEKATTSAEIDPVNSRNFSIRLLLASLVGWSIGTFVGITVGAIGVLFSSNDLRILWLTTGISQASALGIAQWRVLRDRIPKIKWWILFSTTIGIFSSLMSASAIEFVGDSVFTFGINTLIGFCLYWVVMLGMLFWLSKRK